MKTQHLITAILTLVLNASITLHGEDTQSWTASDGRVIQAKFIKLDGESVVIEKDGKQFAVAFAKLNADSVALAKKLGGIVPATTGVTDAKTIASSQLLGKTFQECEGILGKPVSALDSKDGASARYYKSSVPGVSRIKLERIHEGSMDGPVPSTVNSIWYYFPKGETKTIGEAFAKISLDKEGAKVTDWDKPLQGVNSDVFDGIKGDLRAMWGLAKDSEKMPPEYRHAEEDTMWVTKDPNLSVAPAPTLAANDSPELRKSGAFGFPQAAAKILHDDKEFRISAWSNADHLYVQAVVWVDGDDALADGSNGEKLCDQSALCLDLDADRKETPKVDRNYTVDPSPEKRGLYYQIVFREGGGTTGLTNDSKGRGSVQYVAAADGKKIRVDSFIIPLAETGRKSGDKIRLILAGESVKPDYTFNSGGVRVGGADGPMLYSSYLPQPAYHDFTLGEQSGTIDPALVTDGRK